MATAPNESSTPLPARTAAAIHVHVWQVLLPPGRPSASEPSSHRGLWATPLEAQCGETYNA